MKKLVLTIAVMAIMGVGYSQSLESESRKAANQAARGDVSGAAKTASSAFQNKDISKSSTPGMYKAVENKVKEAQKKSTTTSGSTSGNSSATVGKKTSSSSKK